MKHCSILLKLVPTRTSQCNIDQVKPMDKDNKVDKDDKDNMVDNDDEVDNDRNNDDKLEKDTKVDKDDEVDKDIKVDKDDEMDKDDKVDKDDEDHKEEEEDMDKKEEQDEEFFFAKILKMTKYTSLPNLVRLGQWEQVSPYYILVLLVLLVLHSTGENRARLTSSPSQKQKMSIMSVHGRNVSAAEIGLRKQLACNSNLDKVVIIVQQICDSALQWLR